MLPLRFRGISMLRDMPVAEDGVIRPVMDIELHWFSSTSKPSETHTMIVSGWDSILFEVHQQSIEFHATKLTNSLVFNHPDFSNHEGDIRLGMGYYEIQTV